MKIKSIILLTLVCLLNAYNSVPNKMAYWRIKRSFILNNFVNKKAFPLMKYNHFNKTNVYYQFNDIIFEHFFEQHGEVHLLE